MATRRPFGRCAHAAQACTSRASRIQPRSLAQGPLAFLG
eukprot:CAMPEP_0170297836 /NCGR_PEP_ID=MMETSP0116_2-20130129/49082_1 /TAXON_ID=400756 /ORGANISM="Durinskia baltica, Strain CSIRO CS-38" /LENGTH=38 /DNA_ID= /DNA_START= /DNA_END= /DNA_ORIENTATION=